MEIDLSAARATVRELADALSELDGTTVDESPTRAGQRQRAEINRTLQYLAHLGDRVAVEVQDAYWTFKRNDVTRGNRDPE